MGLFSKSRSTSVATQTTNIQDSRVAGVEGSQVASGGGSSVYRETLPVDALGVFIEGINEADARRTSAALEIVRGSQAGQAATVAQLAAQRSSETETLGSTIRELGPIILGAVLLLTLARR